MAPYYDILARDNFLLAFRISKQGNHDSYCLFSMIFLLILMGATSIPNLKFLAYTYL